MSSTARTERHHVWADRSLRTKGLVVVALPIFALAAAFGTFGVLNNQQHVARQAVAHTLAVESQVNTVLVDLLNSEAGVVGYVLTHQSQFLTPYRSAMATTPAALARLGVLVAGHPAEAARLDQVHS
ncbi:MAG: CHASE3 domain-containing protein, partial [Acidimicrobiales bacterium]